MFLMTSVSMAYAQTNNTRLYCAYDYLRHCSAYSLKSPDLPKCMANVGVNLSKRCIQAMVDDGLITKQDVIARAARQGIVVRDGASGLFVDENAKVGEEIATVEMPKETVVVEDVPLVKDENEVGIETTNVLKDISTKAKNVIRSTEREVKKVYTKTKKVVQKTATKVKTKYKKVAKSNIEYAKRPDIVKENKIRKQKVADGFIVSEGVNAAFGRYEARRPGFTPPKPYNWKARQESGGIYSSGVNGY